MVKKVKKPSNKAEEKFDAKAKEAKKANKALEAYLKENNLDPSKDWSKDKKHGKKIKELLAVSKVKTEKADESLKEVKKAKKAGSTMKYDYPLIDGREMTSEEKKKYRVKMRAEAKKANNPAKEGKEDKKPKKEKTGKVAPEPKEEKKAKKDKKKKKALKEED